MKPILHSGPGLVIGIPTLGRPVPLDWAFAFKSMNTPINYNCIIHVVNGKPVADARNEIAYEAIKRDAKYLFFLGDDVICPGHTIKQLIHRMEQDETVGVVGGVYCNKTEPSAPLVFRGNGRGAYWDWKIGEYFEVTGLGMDCNLIRVDLLKQLGNEPFKTVDIDSYADGINNAESWTEDLYFFKRVAEETKYKIYCDGSIICGHADVYGNKIYTLPAGSKPLQTKQATKDKKALLVGRLPMGIDLSEFDVTTFSKQEEADYRGDLGYFPFASDEFDWVIASDLGMFTDMAEFRRIVKSSGKVTLLYHSLIDLNKVALATGGKVVGEAVEVTK